MFLWPELINCATAADELEWVCPASKHPAELQRSLNMIGNFLLDPLDLNGKKALQMVSKVTKRKKKRGAPEQYDSLPDDLDEQKKRGNKRKEKISKEKQETLSAQFIEDSDAELGDDDAFFAAEKALRARMASAAEAGGSVAQHAGTKRKKVADSGDENSDRSGTRKRVRKNNDRNSKRAAEVSSDEGDTDTRQLSPDIANHKTKQTRRGAKDGIRESPSNPSPPPPSHAPSSAAESSEVESESEIPVPNATQSQRKLQRFSGAIESDDSEMEEDDDQEDTAAIKQPARPVRRLVVSDDEE